MHFSRIQRAVALLLLLALSACGGPAANTAEPGPTAGAEFSGTTLVLWHSFSPSAQPTLGRLVGAYNQSNPGTRIVPRAMPRASLADDLRNAALDGTAPHLLILPSHWLGALADEGLLLSLDDKLSSAELAKLIPASVGAARVREADRSRLLGLPLTFDAPVLFYNKANVLAPPPDTASLLSIAHGLSDSSAKPPLWGLAYNLSLDRTIGYLYAFGGRVLDDEGRVVLGSEGRAGAERWLQWLLTLRGDAELLAIADGIRVDAALKSQQALMTVDRADQLLAYRALWGSDLGVAPLPQLSETGALPSVYVQSEVLSINAHVNAAEQAAALDFCRFLLGADAQRQLLEAGLQPTLGDLKLDDASPWAAPARAFREQAANGRAMPNSRAEIELVWPALGQMLRSVLQDQLPPADAVTQTDARLRASLNQ
jgi:ABC-type glycerol-3-phosphate transport system substrate-binding protein